MLLFTQHGKKQGHCSCFYAMPLPFFTPALKFGVSHVRSLRVTSGAQQELQRISLGIYGPIEVHPCSFHFDIGLIHAPGVIRGLKVGSTALLQLGSVALHPPIDGGVVHRKSSFCHHLLQVPVAERIAEVPAHTEQNNLCLKMTPFERSLRFHNHLLLIFWSYPTR